MYIYIYMQIYIYVYTHTHTHTHTHLDYCEMHTFFGLLGHLRRGGGTFSMSSTIAEVCQDVDSDGEAEQAMSGGAVRAFFELGALPDGAALIPLSAALDGDDADATRLCAAEFHLFLMAWSVRPGSRCMTRRRASGAAGGNKAALRLQMHGRVGSGTRGCSRGNAKAAPSRSPSTSTRAHGPLLSGRGPPPQSMGLA